MVSIDDSVFIARCSTAIRMMREAGINEVRLACVLTEVRSAALSQEYFRVTELLRLNPPRHLPHGEMADIVEKIRPKETGP